MSTATLDLPSESKHYVEDYWNDGYAVVRGFVPKAEMAEVQAQARAVYAEGLKHHATYRDRNVLFEILPESFAGQRYVLQAHWFSWYNAFFERFRRSPRYYALLSPFLGRDIKQIAQQIHWKPPGAGVTGFRFHQDLRFRNSEMSFQDVMTASITTGLAIDPATRENGCLRVLPGSHKLGYLGMSDDGPLMKGATQDEDFRRVGLDPAAVVDLELEPGDLAVWGLLTVHGSQPNLSPNDRAFGISSYLRGSIDRGEWAFRDGVSVPLGDEPEICKYEQLREKPGPFYSDDKWYQ